MPQPGARWSRNPLTLPFPAGFRLGNVVHALQATQQSLHATDAVARLCLTLANLNRVLYFICDTVLWAQSMGLAPAVDRKRWRHWASRHYYYSLLLSLARDAYELARHMEQQGRKQARQEAQAVPSVADEDAMWLQSFLLLLLRSLRQQPPLLLDTVKNACDLLSPMNQLGIYESNQGLIGLGGLVSSLAGLVTVLYPHMKLKIR